MKINLAFGLVPDEYALYSDYFTGVDPNGHFKDFYYKLCFDTKDLDGDFVIHDGCERMIPFSFDSLDELVEVLTVLKKYRDEQRAIQQFTQNRFGIQY